MANKKYFLPILLAGVALSACSRDMSDLREYTDNIKQQSTGKVEALPQFKPYESYTYIAERSPFEPLGVAERQQSDATTDNGIRPDGDRRREPLEFYPLDALTLSGSLEKGGTIWGLISDPEGAIHRVKKGNYLGQNYGRIVDVTTSQMTLIELVKDSDGSWVERTSELTVKVPGDEQ